MNNLTTRKIVLGLLMTLVLVFSVQGIAEAYTVTRRSSDDLEIRDIGDRDTFKVSFSVSGVDTTATSTDDLEIPAFTGLTLEKILESYSHFWSSKCGCYTRSSAGRLTMRLIYVSEAPLTLLRTRLTIMLLLDRPR